MKPKIANMNYVYGGDGKLVLFSHLSETPWEVFCGTTHKKFRTHTDAIRWADKQARKGKK